MHSKYLHKLNVLGNVFVKFISPTERLPHQISHKDMPVSRSTSSQKKRGFLPQQYQECLQATSVSI